MQTSETHSAISDRTPLSLIHQLLQHAYNGSELFDKSWGSVKFLAPIVVPMLLWTREES